MASPRFPWVQGSGFRVQLGRSMLDLSAVAVSAKVDVECSIFSYISPSVGRFLFLTFYFSLFICTASAVEFTGPTAWETVNTNGVKTWQAQQVAATSANVRVWAGVIADREKREVRLLAEAVGHNLDTTIEFLIAAPQSNRAYESAMMSVAKPSDIVRALEWIGLPRGTVINGRQFCFWPKGERVSGTIRRLSDKPLSARPLQSVIKDVSKEGPLYGEAGLVFTRGHVEGEYLQRDTDSMLRERPLQ